MSIGKAKRHEAWVLERRTTEVGGPSWTYWVTPASEHPAPLLLVFDAMGMTGPRMANWTGLAQRGPRSRLRDGVSGPVAGAVGRLG